MIGIELSETTIKNKEPKEDNIYLINQFFIHNISERQYEIVQCLRKNVNNSYITKIYLLNERIYTKKELGLKNLDKIVQINIGKRLMYSDIFNFINKENLTGYIIFSNSDIFLDETLKNIYYSNLYFEKSAYCQLRYEYNKQYPKLSKIFGPRSDSQDTWIFHTNYKLSPQLTKSFRFNFGKPGCDNKVIYIFKLLGYKVFNDPSFIKTFHIHKSDIRNYNFDKDLINKPHYYIFPPNQTSSHLDDLLTPKDKNFKNGSINYTRYDFNNENNKLTSYIKRKIENNEKFIIPRIAGIENDCAFIGQVIMSNNNNIDANLLKTINEKICPTMKRNAGIHLPDINTFLAYSRSYCQAFLNSEIYLDWEPWGPVYQAISKSHDFIVNKIQRDKVWAYTMDIFHFIHTNPWTHTLRGKRLLIISPFVYSIKEKIEIREKIYGIDLFPECKFVLLQPPQTQGTNPSRPFNIELENMVKFIDNIKDQFDIALVSCGGYGNLVCNQIFNMGKSAIYVGGVLQMYFGIYGGRWLKERSDILRIFMNEYWSRPKEEEKPNGSELIEKGCYW